jgi:hypothetical protein
VPLLLRRKCSDMNFICLFMSHQLQFHVIIVHLEELTVAWLVKKYPAVYGTRRSATLFPAARHWSYMNPISIRSILILSSFLRLDIPSSPFSSSFPTEIFEIIFPVWLYRACCMAVLTIPFKLITMLQATKIFFMPFSAANR